MPSEQLRLLSVHAHPDDESSKGAATLARCVKEGADVLVVTCTGGERGSVLNPAMDRREIRDRLAEVRREEMARAAELLGVRHAWLGFEDSGLPEGDPPPELPPGCFARLDVEVAAAPLIEIVRRERPHVVVTYDERGGYPHPDHVMCHQVSVAAFDRAGDPAYRPELGAPWQPRKLYYQMSFHRARIQALHDAALAAGLPSPYAERLASWQDRPGDAERVTTRVPCAEYFPIRDQALLAHATQVDPDGGWFALPLELQERAWPTEDYQLARSLVPTTLPEDDLFAGVRD